MEEQTVKRTLLAAAALLPLTTSAFAWGSGPEDRLRQLTAATVFVPDHCRGWTVDWKIANAVVEANGYQPSDLLAAAPSAAIIGTIKALELEPQRACLALIETFGPHGNGVRNVIRRKGSGQR